MSNNSNIWDIPGQGFRTGGASTGITNPNYIRTPPNRIIGSAPLRSVPPPLPPRPQNSYTNNAYNPQGSYYNNFGYGGYSSYTGSNYGFGYRPSYSPYGLGYGGGFGNNPYYAANNPESRFIQLAEESSRPAFRSIQSVLEAFSSVTMMFDSTFNALYSSYMSIIGVADNFGKLRTTFAQIFSALAIFKTLHFLYRRLLYKLGISKINPATESAWVDAFNKSAGLNGNETKGNIKPWATMLFLSVIMGGPYFLFKLMSHIYPKPNREKWDPLRDHGFPAVGVYDFCASNDQELNFSANQKLIVAPEKFQPFVNSGWVLACDEHKRIGLVPNNYVGMMVPPVKRDQTSANQQMEQPVAAAVESIPKPTENVEGEQKDTGNTN